MRKPRLVFVGNGMAGLRTLEELLAVEPDLYEITVLGDEPMPAYDRIQLSPVLAGDKGENELLLRGREWYETSDVRLMAGRRVVSIDRARRRVHADDGSSLHYDRLVLATGARAIRLPLPGADLPGVTVFRNLADVRTMLDMQAEHAVVIGGGLLGLEAAWGLHRQGVEVCVVHLMDHLMERQLDAVAAGMLQSSLTKRGLRFEMQAKTTAILGDRHVRAVRLETGEEIPADLVVMAVGIRPNVDLMVDARLCVDRGVVVNDVMQTFDPRIYAVGECVEHRGATFGLVAPLYEQAKVVANQLAEDGYFRYRPKMVSTRLKVTGVELFSAGRLEASVTGEELVLTDPARGVYKKIVLEDGKVAGAVLYGDTRDGGWYLDLMRKDRDVGGLRDVLLFGKAYAPEEEDLTESGVLLRPVDPMVCDCNGVCRSTIVDAVRAKSLETLADVKLHTKAGASCGGCSSDVEAILAETLGDAYAPNAVVPICSCTELDHDAIREAIVARGLRTMDTVMEALDWRSSDGCAKCRPALNYYLLSAWPGEYEDDGRSRAVNERLHANIQKDGTFSVVPRMFGGLTTPAELRKLADVAERYGVRTVKVTGAQRIDLLGVRKEDLPAVWAELGEVGMVSGHAYGKAVRTVKTCVGSEWCRFGVQDSTRLGVLLERATWAAWTPHKFKMAVSGCPRNCAEATIKDFGVVAVDEGWELHVGGNGGMRVRATEVLCRVASMDEVLEYGAAFLQLYREEGRYLERTAGWIERVGLSYVVQRIVHEEETRGELAKRFRHAQTHAQVDPWKTADPRDFVPLARLTSGAEAFDAAE